MTEAFFEVVQQADGTEWFVPTDHARGPWDPDACHGGPPTGLLVRALERSLPALRLARVAVDLPRPVPMAGFTVTAEVWRTGRATGNTRATLTDAAGKVCATASGMHVAVAPTALFPGPLDNSGLSLPRLADSEPGAFPLGGMRHGLPGFRQAVEIRNPPGQGSDPGLTTLWMRALPLLVEEVMSPFQRVAPLADCTNAFGRHADPDQVAFMNTDLLIALHRDPVGDWVGSRSSSVWDPNGVGLSECALFDDEGQIGRAMQTLLLQPVTGADGAPGRANDTAARAEQAHHTVR